MSIIIMSSRTSDQFIWLVSEKKTEAVNAYLIKNSKREGEEEKNKKKNGGVGGGGGGGGGAFLQAVGERERSHIHAFC